MGQILVRDLDAETVNRLKERAKRHQRSLQAEVKHILTQAAGIGQEEIAEMFNGWKERFAERRFTASADIIRKDRSR